MLTIRSYRRTRAPEPLGKRSPPNSHNSQIVRRVGCFGWGAQRGRLLGARTDFQRLWSVLEGCYDCDGTDGDRSASSLAGGESFVEEHRCGGGPEDRNEVDEQPGDTRAARP